MEERRPKLPEAPDLQDRIEEAYRRTWGGPEPAPDPAHYLDLTGPEGAPCASCGAPVGEGAHDLSHRIGATGEVRERWLCKECGDAEYEYAMGQLP